MARNPVFPSTDGDQQGHAPERTGSAGAPGTAKRDAKAEREKRLGEALRANLRRRKAARATPQNANASEDAAARHEDEGP